MAKIPEGWNKFVNTRTNRHFVYSRKVDGKVLIVAKDPAKWLQLSGSAWQYRVIDETSQSEWDYDDGFDSAEDAMSAADSAVSREGSDP